MKIDIANVIMARNGEFTYPGYEWITLSTPEKVISWVRRNRKLRVTVDLDKERAEDVANQSPV